MLDRPNHFATEAALRLVTLNGIFATKAHLAVQGSSFGSSRRDQMNGIFRSLVFAYAAKLYGS